MFGEAHQIERFMDQGWNLNEDHVAAPAIGQGAPFGRDRASATLNALASIITAEFELDRDVDVALQDVRDKISRVRGELPDDVEEPVVAKQEADAQPFMWLALSGDNYDLLQLSDEGAILCSVAIFNGGHDAQFVETRKDGTHGRFLVTKECTSPNPYECPA